jgi:hypothetical protein
MATIPGVLDAAHRVHLAQEALDRDRVLRQLVVQHLHRHRRAVGVGREVHRAPAPLPMVPVIV